MIQELELLRLVKIFGEVVVIKMLYQFKKYKQPNKEQNAQECDEKKLV
ncbi:MAG TPA: hypothetical protein VMU83_02055 [Hanamia sp.]|nr:hypothetical protein [Hanamia sp.]